MTIGIGIRRRLATVAVVLFGLLLGIGYRAYSMQVKRGDHFDALADKQHLRTVEVPAPRGAIFDRRGVELAVTADADSVWANPRDVIDVAGTAAALAPTLGISRENLFKRLSGERYFVWLKRHVDTEAAREIGELGLPGVSVTSEPRRFYPGKSLAGPVLGFADIDGRGLDGLELSMDDLLVGSRGRVRGIRDATGKLMLPDQEQEAVAGSALTLTVDRTIQFVTEKAIERAVREHSATSGVAIVIEVGTGDVLAMANVPGTDPNRPDASLDNARNRAITDAFEIGSVMKLFSVAAALEAGVVTPTTRFKTYGGKMRIRGGNVVHDSFRDNELTVSEIIKRSSNVGALQIGRRLGRQKLHDGLRRYHFGSKTGIEVHGERSGLVRPANKWGPTDLVVISYGYGMTATPLQAVSALAAIGSGGIYFPPRLIGEVRAPDGEVTFGRHPIGERMMKAEVASDMMEMMRTVFDKGRDGGTARALTLKGYSAAGKTGTARKIDPAGGGYGKLYLSSFAGLAPAHAPRIAVFVLVDEPHSGHYYGSVVAGPAFVEIISGALEVLGVAPDAPILEPEMEAAEAPATELDPDADLDAELAPEKEARFGDLRIPDFRGLTIAAALRLAAESGVEIDVRGTGIASSQSQGPGPAPATSTCVVEFHSPAITAAAK